LQAETGMACKFNGKLRVQAWRSLEERKEGGSASGGHFAEDGQGRGIVHAQTRAGGAVQAQEMQHRRVKAGARDARKPREMQGKEVGGES